MSVIQLVQSLVDHSVDFVVIGGWSAIIHGSANVTSDVDICYSRESGNLSRLVRSLAPFHPRLRGVPSDLPFIWDEVMVSNGTIFTLSTDAGPIDLLAEVAPLGGFDSVKSRSVTVQAFGRTVWTLDLPALIESKRAAGREKDLRSLPELEGLLEARTDES